MYETLQAQIDTESDCRPCLLRAATTTTPPLDVRRHTAFLLRGLGPLSAGYVSLDAARPWLFYWCLTGLALLPDTTTTASDVAPFADRLVSSALACRCLDGGGFGGGPGQMGHLAPTYAIVLALAVTGDAGSFERVIDRRSLYAWIMSLKQPDGGFAIQRDGEVDARAAYLALSVASLLDLCTPEMVTGTAEWIARCQTFEGGLSGLHGAEAHGGLAFCALATLCILGEPAVVLGRTLDLPALLRWLAARQMSVEGGFSGRTNKLVDGCYSWWVGAEYALVETAMGIQDTVLDREALSRYVLACCQTPGRGGLRDKPGKQPDYYHTCYCLAGLSAAQHVYAYDGSRKADDGIGWQSFCWTADPFVGDGSVSRPSDRVGAIHPIYALPWGKAEKMRAWSVAQGGL